MKSALVVSVALLWSSVAGSLAQNSASTSDFSLPPMRLRTELTLDSPRLPVPSPFPIHVLDTNSPSRDVSASTPDAASALQSYNARSDRFFLVRPLERAPETPLERTFNSIGQPEVVRLGNASLESSVVTAVKRRNPLCLINATFLKMTW